MELAAVVEAVAHADELAADVEAEAGAVVLAAVVEAEAGEEWHVEVDEAMEGAEEQARGGRCRGRRSRIGRHVAAEVDVE
jgi:hypothetical protein